MTKAEMKQSSRLNLKGRNKKRRDNKMNKWNKKEYLESRTKYYREEHGLSLRFAKECAEEDWERYLEKYN
jgi:hypothetical protein